MPKKRGGYSSSYLDYLELQIFFFNKFGAIAFLCYVRNIEAIDFSLKWQFECKGLTIYFLEFK